MTIIEELLEHHGIKGMHWGVRGGSSGPQKVTIREKGKKLKTSGGGGHSAHPDAVKAHTIGRKAKKSGTKALSNEELQAYTKRLQLEQNVSQLTTKQSSNGSKFAKNILSRVGNKAVDEAINAGTNGIKTAIRRQMMFK